MDRFNGPSVIDATWGHTMPTPVPVPVLPLSTYTAQLLSIGSVGPVVAAVLRAVGADPDGALGQLTAATLRTFQTAHGLPATGMTDTGTCAILLPPFAPAPVPTPTPASVPVPRPAPVPVPVVYPLAHYKGQLLQVSATGPAVSRTPAGAAGGRGRTVRAAHPRGCRVLPADPAAACDRDRHDGRVGRPHHRALTTST